ncbi:MAG: D-hexose-6-phosphate mutarotase [Gammaproteobacteria bacterium]
MDTSALSKKFGIPDQIKFETTDQDLIIVHIDNVYAKVKICLQGAQLLSWIKKDQIKNLPDVIWLSEDAALTKGRSIRGGIPICWPWFGAHPIEKGFPSHGYARTQAWELIKVEKFTNGKTFLSLRLIQDGVTEQHRLKGVECELQISIGEKLEMVLISKNTGREMITVGGAFHTYFNVSDISNIRIEGLENKSYIDTLDGWQNKKETESIKIDSEIDRIYQDEPANDNVIIDRGLDRKIRIRKRGSHSSVVWNPWIEKSTRLGDMGIDGYRKMICVETCNAAEDVISIKAGGEHRLSVCYSLEDL